MDALGCPCSVICIALLHSFHPSSTNQYAKYYKVRKHKPLVTDEDRKTFAKWATGEKLLQMSQLVPHAVTGGDEGEDY